MPVARRIAPIRRMVAALSRMVAPAISIVARLVRSDFWVETEQRRPGDGPDVVMLSRPDIQRPRDGAGPLNHRQYRAHISGSERTPEEIMEAFRRDPNAFSPTSFATFDPSPGPQGMTVGDEITVRLPGPWDGPVVVADVQPLMVRLETLEDHMEAGWIQFRSERDREGLVFEIESVARSGDPLFDALYHPGRVAKLVQTEMWVRVVEAVVAFSGGRSVGRILVDTIIYEGPET